MRFALSAAAAASGVVLFAAALFGQPEAYLRHARQQWDSWINFEPSSAVADQDAGRQDGGRTELAVRVQALQDEVNQLKDQLATKPAKPEVAQGTPPAANASRLPQAAQALAATPDAGVTTLNGPTEKHAVAAPAEHREAAGKPAGVTPPKASVVRPEPDDARSVLARLRQVQPAPAPVIDPPEERAKPVAAPAVSRMTAAQFAFNNGRVEDGRRLLQEAQLLLVFRPAGSSSDDASAAGRGSVDIAHALEALGGNDIARCRLFIDRAINDMAGIGSDAPEREVVSRRTGYAPAYPPR